MNFDAPKEPKVRGNTEAYRITEIIWDILETYDNIDYSCIRNP